VLVFLLGSFKDMKFEIMTSYGKFWILIIFEHKSFKNPRNKFSDFYKI